MRKPHSFTLKATEAIPSVKTAINNETSQPPIFRAIPNMYIVTKQIFTPKFSACLQVPSLGLVLTTSCLASLDLGESTTFQKNLPITCLSCEETFSNVTHSFR